MKENKYDNDNFFEKYSMFERSVHGISAAGEWHELQKMMPNFTGKRVLDIGCGFGWHCIYAAQNGAKTVLGTDISEKMLAVVQKKNIYKNVEYKQIAMEDLDFKKDSFDVVISSLALHYTPNFKDICARIAKCLTKGGDFIFSVEHPIFTSQGKQDWIYDKDGNAQYWPVDNYFTEGMRSSVFLGEQVVKYHKTLTTYLNTLIEMGFSITKVIEPQPQEHLLDSVPNMRNELRRPMMLLVSAKKISDEQL